MKNKAQTFIIFPRFFIFCIDCVFQHIVDDVIKYKSSFFLQFGTYSATVCEHDESSEHKNNKIVNSDQTR